MDEEGRFGVGQRDGAPRRGRAPGFALAASLMVHGLALLHGPSGAPPESGPRTLSVELVRMPPPRMLPGRDDSASPPRPRPVAERPVFEQPAPERSDPTDPGDGAIEDRPRRGAGVAMPADGALDLSVPDRFLTPAPRRRELLDGRFAEQLREARAARRGSAGSTVGGPITRDGAREGRMRIETSRGCFERVTDPFDGQAGDQWWFVACGDREPAIDWGARFRARP
jgi:hypothetical protein